MDNNQLISARSDGNQINHKSSAGQRCQLLEAGLYPGTSDLVAMKIR